MYTYVCINTYRWIFSRRQEAQQPNQLEESSVLMRISACGADRLLFVLVPSKKKKV